MRLLGPLIVLLILLALTLFAWTSPTGAAPATQPGAGLGVAELRCEYLTDPIGLTETAPRLSWIVTSDERNQKQSAYRILVSSTAALLAKDQGDLWDSGRVASNETNQIVYGGKPLVPRMICHWKVQAWDRDGVASGWSKPAGWEMGLLSASDWSAAWIAGRPVTDADRPTTRPSTRPNPPPAYLRKSFTLPAAGSVRSARLYVTALGVYEIRINGERVGDEVLAPGWTDYSKRVQVQTYDVTSLLNGRDGLNGENVIAALVADGWYCGHVGYGFFQRWGKVPALLAQLEITLGDGTTRRIVTDESWKMHVSPFELADELMGESYNAMKEVDGWDSPGLDASDWTPATTRPAPSGVTLEGPNAPPVRQLMEIKPKSISEPRPGHWVLDMGQNMVGVVRLRVAEPEDTTITLRHAEMLNPDGTIYTANLRKAVSTDHYNTKGKGIEVWQPRFTFHGFRYVEITGLSGKPTEDTITGVVLGTDLPAWNTFECSDPRINQLQSNIQWGMRGNYLSVPTDCPQRDERLGWMGDAQVFVRTAAYNADISAFFTKWLNDVDDAQLPDGRFTDFAPAPTRQQGAPAWGDAGVICPWAIYQMYGDRRVLEKHLPAMIKWIEWNRAHANNFIRDKDRGKDHGDWLAADPGTPKDLIGTAFFANSTRLVAAACRAVGRNDDAAKYDALFEQIKAAFNQKYVTQDGRITGNTQCVYELALRFNLLSDENRAKAAQYLADDIHKRDNHLSTGFIGVGLLLPVLTDADQLDTAYRLLLQDSYPSWLFSVKQGATTIWERWDGWTPDKGFQTPSMNSFNHYSLGACGQWMFDTVAGIGVDPASPGFGHVLIRPRPDPAGGVTWAKATVHTIRGPVSTDWSLKDGTFTLNVTIPANTTADLTLPGAPNLADIREGGHPLAEAPGITVTRSTDPPVLHIGSGTYVFTSHP